MPTPVVLIGLDPKKYMNGHVSYVVAHAMAARRAGLEPHIFCVGSTAEIERTEFGTIHRVATPFRHLLLAQADTRPLANAIVAHLANCGDEPPFVIHGFGPRGAVAVAAAAQLERRGIAAVPVASAYTAAAPEWRVILRGLRTDHGVRWALFHAAWYPWVATAVARTERRGFLRARVVLVNYDSVTRLLRREYGAGVATRRIPYAPLTAFDPEPAAPSARPPAPVAALEPADAPLIVSVSRHGPNKGVDVLLRTLGSLKSRGVRFRACLVGPGRLIDADRRLAVRLGLDGSVAIPGMVDDVVPYLRSADVFVLPSLGEQSGSVALLEALQSGTAVVASDCDGIPEDVTDGQQALLVAPGDPAALGEALARLIGDPQLRADLGARGRERFEERFSADTFVTALRDVYAELGAISR